MVQRLHYCVEGAVNASAHAQWPTCLRGPEATWASGEPEAPGLQAARCHLRQSSLADLLPLLACAAVTASGMAWSLMVSHGLVTYGVTAPVGGDRWRVLLLWALAWLLLQGAYGGGRGGHCCPPAALVSYQRWLRACCGLG
ncbi:hypothetical protein NDU88_000300 [Pleurodeles waltl]|uniref:Uncharacterized protein n=1 Tax=Pleurodeles waltl TaxID=8319 RepID=A0AAV7UPK6_PLEWA|nr:hypothetical protein NDU88_000300 [Pleurodeles waltl]